MDSILLTVKKMLGLAPDYNAFDTDILVNINAAFMSLMQIGIGPKTGYTVTGDTETWDDYISSMTQPMTELGALQNYVYLKVKTVFDPPTSSFVLDSMNKLMLEYEYRLNLQVDKGGESDGTELPDALRRIRHEMGCEERP